MVFTITDLWDKHGFHIWSTHFPIVMKTWVIFHQILSCTENYYNDKVLVGSAFISQLHLELLTDCMLGECFARIQKTIYFSALWTSFSQKELLVSFPPGLYHLSQNMKGLLFFQLCMAEVNSQCEWEWVLRFHTVLAAEAIVLAKIDSTIKSHPRLSPLTQSKGGARDRF